MANGRGGARPGAGRKVGQRSQKALDIERYAKTIVEDPTVQAMLLTQAQQGLLPAPVLQMLFYYAYGRPIERHEHTGAAGTPLQITLVDYSQHA